MYCTGIHRPRGVPFSDNRYIKGEEFHKLRHRKRYGKLSLRVSKGLTADPFKYVRGYSKDKFVLSHSLINQNASFVFPFSLQHVSG